MSPRPPRPPPPRRPSLPAVAGLLVASTHSHRPASAVHAPLQLPHWPLQSRTPWPNGRDPTIPPRAGPAIARPPRPPPPRRPSLPAVAGLLVASTHSHRPASAVHAPLQLPHWPLQSRTPWPNGRDPRITPRAGPVIARPPRPPPPRRPSLPAVAGLLVASTHSHRPASAVHAPLQLPHWPLQSRTPCLRPPSCHSRAPLTVPIGDVASPRGLTWASANGCVRRACVCVWERGGQRQL
jgi:hypothetical protein